MLEKTVEAYLVERVRALGGTAYKFTSPARASVPDRIVILPPGRIYFVELKRPGGKLTRGQEREHEHLRRLGADVRTLDSIGAINAFLNGVQAVAADGASTDETMSLRVALDFADNPRPTHALCAPADTNGELYRALRVLADAYRRAAVSPATAEPARAQLRCRKCGDRYEVAFSYAKASTATCCRQTPCAHPGVGPCDKPAAATAEQCAHDYVRSDGVCTECGENPATADERAADACCPFCGSDDFYTDSALGKRQALCNSCEAAGPTEETDDEAIASFTRMRASQAAAPTPQQISDYLHMLDAVQREVVEREARALEPTQGTWFAKAQAAAPADAREPVVLWQDGTGMLWDTYSHGKWMHRFVSPHGWDAHAVAQHLYGKGYAGNLEVRAVWSGNYAAPADAGEAVADTPASPVGTNSGHGHVWARPDGMKARCGGPMMCKQCAIDAARAQGGKGGEA
ncbi:hypothetical protein [Burkholderia gladioli]|uniref:hypothetical protein n=1 Tax=Burkholderia gladioli TaxID=28095 RepID=UPI001ABAF3D2|nr:hypothetical protein [Burkholderia gladioli]